MSYRINYVGVATFLMLLSLSLFLSCRTISTHNRGDSWTFAWRVVSKPSEDDAASLRKVYFFDEQNGIALTLTSIYGTKNGGKTWRILHSFDNTVLSSFAIVDAEVWVVGGKYVEGERTSPVIFRSSNGGTDWIEVNFSEQTHTQIVSNFSSFDDLCFDVNRNLWLAGDGGALRVEVGENDALASRIPSLNKKIRRVFCGISEIWGLGEGGTVAIFSNNQWQSKNLGTERSFTRMAFCGEHIWLTGVSTSTETNGNGVLMRSKDRGLTWENRNIENALGLTDIWFDGNNGWIVGIKGQIYSTADGGGTWSRVKSPTSNNLLSVFFLDQEKGWAVGDRGVVLTYSGN